MISFLYVNFVFWVVGKLTYQTFSAWANSGREFTVTHGREHYFSSIQRLRFARER